MAASEIWDYLPATPVTADYTTTTLSLAPQNVLVEDGAKKQVVHTFDDGSQEVITLSEQSVFFVTLQWDLMNESDSGTLFNMFHNSSMGNGLARSFYWEHPSDGHTYTVVFASVLPRNIKPGLVYGFSQVRLKILGRDS